MGRFAKYVEEEDKTQPTGKKPGRFAKYVEPPAPKKPIPKVPAAALPKSGKKDYTWSEAFAAAPGSARQGIADALEGAGNLAYDAITAPGQTAYRVGSAAADVAAAVGNIGAGAYTNMLDPATKGKLLAADPRFGRASGTADAVGNYYAGYTDPAELRRRIAEHPIATTMDIGSVATLPMGVGGVARAAATAPRGGRVAAALQAADEAPTLAGMARSIPRYAAMPPHLINDATAYVAGRAIPAAARKVETVARPVNAMMMRAAEGRGPQAAAALRAAAPIVPGSVPPTSQAVGAARVPGVAALASSAAKARPALADAQVMTQNNARLAQLRRIGEVPDNFGVPQGLPLNERVQAIFERRNAQRANDYGISDNIVAEATPRMLEILDLPLTSGVGDRNVLARARELALQEERAFDMGTPAQAARPAGWTVDAYGQQVWDPGAAAVAARMPKWSGRDLDFIKKGFDDLAFPKGADPTGGLKPNQLAALRNSRTAFLTHADALIPEYGVSRANYAQNTRLWNRSRIAQYLEQKLSNPTLADDTMAQRADSFNTAVNEVPNVNPSVNKVTGQPRRLDEVLTPEEMTYLREITDDLGSAKLGEAQASKGTPEFGNSLNTIKSDALGIDLNGPYAWMARPLVGGANKYYGNQVTNAMMTPEGAASLMERALAREQTIARYNQAYGIGRNVATYINPARWAFRYPTLMNAMNAQEQQPQ